MQNWSQIEKKTNVNCESQIEKKLVAKIGVEM